MRAVPVLLALCALSTTACAAADVLLIEQPAALRILDRYQQTVEHPSSAGIAPFVPMTIIQERTTLSDGFTPSTRVEINGQTFFLLTDQSGRLLRAGDPGTVRRHQGVELVGDTIEILQGGPLSLQDPLRRSSGTLRAGVLLRREFRLGSETYVRVLDGGDRCGWAKFPQGSRLWRPYQAGSASTDEQLRGVEGRVEQLLRQTNALMDSLFAFMNARTRSSRTAPRWELQVADGGLSCVLRGSTDPAPMAESTAALARRIELAVSGSGYRVTQSAGTIRIRP